ncbi:VOC family protein [Zavarzinia compransoris]|uniref:Extradiol dioxygenase n=1 Tax=Zavarzinia compransoris TaxID=1264899 RepID=A0A317DUD3_9PROT|nr:VOC family protein [Zavarzinia compransoris]PWR18298.1 extradiol dioxygenase [Zavarzinia compransoris]TDP43645.1 glyoxalase/bleomycin resistance protein/dioxygenase superfamily protein [Zavarzinia compransoris]
MTRLITRAAEPVVRIADVAYLRFGRRDLDTATRYFADFGLTVAARGADAVYFRGVLPQAHIVIVERAPHDSFLALGLRAAGDGDLDRLARAHDEDVRTSAEPGGGRILSLTDPSGFRVEVVHGLAALPPLPHRQPRVWNYPGQKNRVNAPQPAIPEPAEVFRLGHVVMQRQEFARNANWYVENFGLIASDVEILPESHEPVLAFLRCDRGAEPADHHSIVIASGPRDHYDHAAFEVLDLDAVALGGEYLLRRGWVQNWGVGRHILGSQVFNYHFDPAGFAVEHYADGDVFDTLYPTRFHVTGKESIYQWGPEMPRHFIDGRPSLELIGSIVKGLRHRADFSLRRLAALKKAFDIPPRPWAGKTIRKPKAR